MKAVKKLALTSLMGVATAAAITGCGGGGENSGSGSGSNAFSAGSSTAIDAWRKRPDTAPVPSPTPAPAPVPAPAPAPTPPDRTSGSGADVLVINLSEDAYQGDAQFTVSVDGVQQGGIQTATASHQAGANQAFTFKGDFGAGPHTVGVNFLNDLYDGTPSTDRNLYVNGISVNGQTMPNGSADLMSAGNVDFYIVSAPAPSPSTVISAAPAPAPAPAPALAPATVTVISAVPPARAPAPAPAPNAPATSGDIVNGAGVLDASAYRSVAAQMGLDAGIAYRYGPSAAAYGLSSASMPTLNALPQSSLDVISDQVVGGGRRARPCFIGQCGTYSVGGPPQLDGGGDYSSNQGQVAFVADNPSQRIGVADLTTLEVGSNVVTTKPLLPWTYYGAGLDSVNQAAYQQQGKATVQPVALANAEGRPGDVNNSIVAYQGGLLGASGQNTANNQATAQLAPGLVPTSVAVTNSSEFALVTVWDTNNLAGKVAVVALAGTPPGGYLGTDPAGWESYRGEWRGVFPGMPSMGNLGFMKVLGYIDLPDMKAPTEIAVTTAWDWGGYTLSRNGYDLKDGATRSRFANGGDLAAAYPRGGVAVVVSKSEKKATFIDLAPLFARFRAVSFGQGAYPAVGMAAGQWPQTFDAQASQKPKIIKTVALANAPTAVKAYAFDDARRAWIATQEGTLHTFDLGDYPTDGAANPASIREVGSVAVGRNPTGIAMVKRRINVDHIAADGYRSVLYPDIRRELLVTSRGDRKVDWVRFDGGFSTGRVVRTLRDSRLVDPIRAEDSDNHQAENYLLSVTDYAGKQLANYRYGPSIYWWFQGVMSDDPSNPLSFNWTACRPPAGCPVGSTTFGGVRYDMEFAGAFALQGKAVQHVSSNVY